MNELKYRSNSRLVRVFLMFVVKSCLEYAYFKKKNKKNKHLWREG